MAALDAAADAFLAAHPTPVPDAAPLDNQTNEARQHARDRCASYARSGRPPTPLLFRAASGFDRLATGAKPLLTPLQFAAGKLFERDHDSLGATTSNIQATLAHMNYGLTIRDPDDVGLLCWRQERRHERTALKEMELERRSRLGEPAALPWKGYDLLPEIVTKETPSFDPPDVEELVARAWRVRTLRRRLTADTYARLHVVIVEDVSLRGLAERDGISQRRATENLLSALEALVQVYADLDDDFARAVMRARRDAEVDDKAESSKPTGLKAGSVAAIDQRRKRRAALAVKEAAEIARLRLAS